MTTAMEAAFTKANQLKIKKTNKAFVHIYPKTAIQMRKSELKEVAHTSLVRIGRDFSTYTEVRPFINKLCKKGTESAYRKALHAFKMMYVASKSVSYRQARKNVFTALKMPV